MRLQCAARFANQILKRDIDLAPAFRAFQSRGGEVSNFIENSQYEAFVVKYYCFWQLPTPTARSRSYHWKPEQLTDEIRELLNLEVTDIELKTGAGIVGRHKSDLLGRGRLSSVHHGQVWTFGPTC